MFLVYVELLVALYSSSKLRNENAEKNFLWNLEFPVRSNGLTVAKFSKDVHTVIDEVEKSNNNYHWQKINETYHSTGKTENDEQSSFLMVSITEFWCFCITGRGFTVESSMFRLRFDSFCRVDRDFFSRLPLGSLSSLSISKEWISIDIEQKPV